MLFEISILILLVGGFIAIALLLRSTIGKQKPSDELIRIVSILQEGSKEDRRLLLTNLERNTRSLNERLDNASRVIGQVQKNIGEMSEIGRGMKDIHAFLHSPKIRGTIGEQVLKELLTQFLPKQSFHLQYQFKNGVTVDAAITTQNGIIPIDSKFPMENFRHMNESKTELEQKQFRSLFINDVKKHIRSIGEKYIQTDQGTIDYALMYIPSEAVYYEIVNDVGLYESATNMRVLPVSPTTFYAFLKAILMSFEGHKIEKEAQEILRSFRSIQKDYEKLEGALGTLTRHITNAYNVTTTVLSHFGTLGQKITGVNQLKYKPHQTEIDE
jgi:DNA recombination protein RmuC